MLLEPFALDLHDTAWTDEKRGNLRMAHAAMKMVRCKGRSHSHPSIEDRHSRHFTILTRDVRCTAILVDTLHVYICGFKQNTVLL